MKFANKPLVLALATVLLAAGLGACDSHHTAGENIDRALEKTGDKVVEAGEAIKPK